MTSRSRELINCLAGHVHALQSLSPPTKRKLTVKSALRVSAVKYPLNPRGLQNTTCRGNLRKEQASIQKPYTNHTDTIYKPYPQELPILDQYYTSTIAVAYASQGTHHTHIERTRQNMAKVTLNQLLELLRGGIGGLVFRQMPDGTIILSGAPRPDKAELPRNRKCTASAFESQPNRRAGRLINIPSMLSWRMGHGNPPTISLSPTGGTPR